MLSGAAKDHCPKCLSNGMMNTLAIGRFLAEFIQLPYDCTLVDITRALHTAGAFDIPCSGKDTKSLRGDFIEKIASAVHDVYAVCVEYADRPVPPS